jgi:precorrin-6B methylase 2
VKEIKNLHFLLFAVFTVFLVTGCTNTATQQSASAQTAQPSATQTGNSNASSNTNSSKPLREPDVIYVPTPTEVVDEMLRLAEVKEGDVLYDLGSGDGRIPITAAKRFKIRAVGIEINPVRIEEANRNAEENDVTDLVTFRNEDLFESDFSEATIVTLYLLDSLNQKLRPKLMRELKPGTRIVSHAFRMGDWEPEQTVEVNGSMVYFWRIPERAK